MRIWISFTERAANLDIDYPALEELILKELQEASSLHCLASQTEPGVFLSKIVEGVGVPWATYSHSLPLDGVDRIVSLCRDYSDMWYGDLKRTKSILVPVKARAYWL